jgi:endonuclease/exonuclease/phosphatase family metal-dependent hydrolase
VILDLDGLPMAFYNISLATPLEGNWQNRLSFQTPFLSLIARYDDSERNGQIRKLAAQIEAETPPYIVAGDFNLSDQSSFYGILAARMGDSFREAGTDLGLTWPAFPALGVSSLFPPLIRMDYVWHSTGIRARSAFVGPYLGSDHLPVDVMLDVALTADD